MKIKIKVMPNSKRQEVIKNEEGYKVYLKSTPEKNKANAELIALLSRYFNKPVRIKSGFTSKNKTIEIEK